MSAGWVAERAHRTCSGPSRLVECGHLWLALERYSGECFLRASHHHRPAARLDLGVLRAEPQRTANECSKELRTRGRRHLPLEGVIVAIERAGWRFKNPGCVVTLRGCELDLLFASPAMVKQ